MVLGRDVPWLLKDWVDRSPDRVFLNWAPHDAPGRKWSYAEFDRDVRKAATGLLSLGVNQSDRVFIHLDNCPELLISYFACAAIGAIAVLGNTRSSQAELEYFVALASPKALVISDRFGELFLKLSKDNIIVFVSETAEANPAASEERQGCTSFDYLVDHAPFSNDRPRDPLLNLRVQFTSGTTARAKAVLSTHANALFAAQQTAYAYNLQPDDLCQVFVPLFHNNGLSTLVMSTLWVGGSILLQPKFSASNFWGPAVDYGATWTSLPGAFFLNALAKREAPDHKFRFWFSGVIPEMAEKYGIQMRGHWGMSEMIALPIVGDPFHEDGRLNIGRPAPATEVSIRRPDGSECGIGEAGDLFVRGVPGITIFKEYLNDPEATAASFDKEGWFETGDRVELGQDGAIYFSSRAKDIIRVGGENVAAADIEAVLLASGWLLECAVVARPDGVYDEVPIAFVVPDDDAPDDLADALIDYCSGRISDFKAPREIISLRELPRSTLNKVSKVELRRLITASS